MAMEHTKHNILTRSTHIDSVIGHKYVTMHDHYTIKTRQHPSLGVMSTGLHCRCAPTVPHRDREEISKDALNTPPHPRTGRHPVDYMYLRTLGGRENWI